MKRFTLLFAFLCLLSTISFSQDSKYGHLNIGNIVSTLPATKAANSELKAYQEQLVTKGEEMATNFEEEYADFVTKAQGGDLSPKQQEERQSYLQKKQQEIIAYEQEITQKVQQKRQELLTPILVKVEEAIDQVARENGYAMIFDTSAFNAVLYVKDSDDIADLVKTKLGI
ncbi:MAG: OmpH family outer membrane protein [Saprospiraceae bacterium]|nr:OmpH family outer membrane protein [Saprospiraceae bacterium]